MTPNGMDRLLSSTVKLGVDGSVAIGPKGSGAQGTLADFVTFTRAKGLYAGVSFDGASIRTRDDLNAAYFGEDVVPLILLLRIRRNPIPIPRNCRPRWQRPVRNNSRQRRRLITFSNSLCSVQEDKRLAVSNSLP